MVCVNLRSLREKQNIKDMTSKLFFQALTKFLAGLVLASPWSFLIMLLYIPIIAKRIRNEEVVLEQGLEGYTE